MARSIEEIEKIITDQAANDDVLKVEFTSTSKASIWRLFAYCVAYCINTLENLFDAHRAEIQTLLDNQRVHKVNWYVSKAKAFQYGYSTVTDTDMYDNTGISDDAIAASQIIKFAAATESTTESRISIQIAGDASGVPAPLSDDQKDAFSTYMEDIKDAGVLISVISNDADRLYPYIDIYYDPQILDSSGNNILVGGKPVEDAIKSYLQNLPFSGELTLNSFVDKLQSIPGVIIPNLIQLQTSWIVGADYISPVAISIKKKPVSGFFKVVNYDNVHYIANV